MMDAFLGIDTSCYTTSICLADASFRVLADARRILDVRAGERGLSQSVMVYQHMRNLPVLFEEIGQDWKKYTIRAAAVTDAPRRREDSYMPAFLAGLGYGRSLAALLQVPLYRISHQENHIFAVLRSAGMSPENPVYAIHLSGGTTDLLYAEPDQQGFVITRIGGSSDISAGQFIDRVGVSLGLPFPAGRHVEKLARRGDPGIRGDRVFCRHGEISFSGVESKAQRLIAKGHVIPENMCLWTLCTVWNGLKQLLEYARAQGMMCMVTAGGVMSNGLLRQSLETYAAAHGIRIEAGEAAYSADNATGAAFWAAWKEGKRR